MYFISYILRRNLDSRSVKPYLLKRLVASRGVQICHRPKSYDRFAIDFTTDLLPIIDENSVVNLWLSIFESVVRTIDFFPMIDKKSMVNLWLIYGESMVEVQPYYYTQQSLKTLQNLVVLGNSIRIRAQ